MTTWPTTLLRRARALTVAGAALAAAVLLPGTAADAAAPAGPTGRIAFSVDTRDDGACCRLNLATMRADGSALHLLTHVGPDVFAQHPAWSPSGASLAYDLGPSGPGSTQIWTVGADGSGAHRLVADPFFRDFEPSWSPDGTRLLFTRCRPDFSACALYQAAANGSHLRELLPFRTEILNFRATFSPDGSRIAVGSRNRAGVQGAVYVLRADGSDLHRVTPPELGAFGPSWTPDGRHLLMATNCCTPAHAAISRIGVDGTGLVQLTRPGAQHDVYPSASPDSRYVAFERNNPDFTGFAVWVMRADGSDPHRVGPALSGEPAWQPTS